MVSLVFESKVIFVLDTPMTSLLEYFLQYVVLEIYYLDENVDETQHQFQVMDTGCI